MVAYDHDPPPTTEQIVVQTSGEGDESMLDTIVRALAIAKNVPASDLDPLYERVDSEALVSLLGRPQRHEATVCIEFAIDEHWVLVSNDRRVCVHVGDPAMNAIPE